MIVLALDTATGGCGACLWSDAAGMLALRVEPVERGLAERLVPLVLSLMADAGLGFPEVDRFSATVGPGSFTGLRVGLAAAQGFALAGDRPLVGFTSFAVAVAALPPALRDARVPIACIDSRRDNLFLQPFADAGALPSGPPVDLRPSEVPGWVAQMAAGRPVVLAGDGAMRAADLLRGVVDADAAPLDRLAHVEALARLAAELDAPGMAAHPPEPFYLRSPDVSVGRQK